MLLPPLLESGKEKTVAWLLLMKPQLLVEMWSPPVFALSLKMLGPSLLRLAFVTMGQPTCASHRVDVAGDISG